MSNNEALGQKQTDKGTQFPPFKQNKGLYLSCLLVLCLWVIFCWQGIRTVVEIWYGNEIFNHGFFIVPGALYLIYLKRHALLAQPINTTPLAFIIIIPSILLYVVGVAGDIQLFMHTATFTLFPSLIWLMIGTKAAKTIFFPLVFMLFSIPVGEQLIPYLQEIAADGSVALLQLTGVPLFRSGLYIEIPQGRFLVAEACSGVSFFIASFVIGSLYAYLNLASVKPRVTFVAISLIFPVLANIVRVYGIILIAYWTDMEHAAGADHLIYGWFFFAFVILCLLGIGELMRGSSEANLTPKKSTANNAIGTQSLFTVNTSRSITLTAVALLLVSTTWSKAVSHANNSALVIPPVKLSAQLSTLGILSDSTCKRGNWQPAISQPDIQAHVYVANTGCTLQLYSAWFGEAENELVSDLHRVFDPERFSLSGVQEVTVNNATSDTAHFNVYQVVSITGEKLSIARWYEVDDTVFTSAIKTKIHQLKSVLLGNPSSGTMWIVALEGHDVAQVGDSLTFILGKRSE